MKTIILFIAALLILSTAAAADCIPLTDGMVIRASQVTVCPGAYLLPNGISIERDSVYIDFGGATIEGSLKGNGITIRGFNDVSLNNVVIRSYNFGVYAENAKGITVNKATITDAFHGIHYDDESSVITTDVFYERNSQDMLQSNKQESAPPVIDIPAASAPETKPEAPTAGSADMTFENVVDEKIVDELGIRSKYEEAKKKVSIERKKKLVGESTIQYTIEVTAKEYVDNLEIYEVIPKTLVEHSYLIEADQEFTVKKEDPIIIFRIGEAKEGEKHVITYKISKPELTEVNPFSVASIEHFINPTNNKIITVMFAIALILLLVNMFLKKEISERVRK